MTSDKRVIGVDEAGKGDFFGPLVVAGFLCKDSQFERLAEIGVRDGKLIAHNKLLTIDERLRQLFPHFVLAISPEEYNSKYKVIKNLNKLLAEAHANVIAELVSNNGADRIIVDKFGKSDLVENELAKRKIVIDLVQEEKGERHLPVAAASILARAGFIRAMDELSKQFGMTIPKGASSIVDDAGKKIIKKFGDKVLLKLAKVHFKNYNRVLSPSLFS